MSGNTLAVGVLLLCLGLAVGYFFGYDHGWEKAVAEFDLEDTEEVVDDGRVGIANPASVFCVESGGTLDIRETTEGQVGICVFSDGRECEEWAMFRSGGCPNGE